MTADEKLQQYYEKKTVQLREEVERAIATFAAHQIYAMRKPVDLHELLSEIEADMLQGINECNADLVELSQPLE